MKIGEGTFRSKPQILYVPKAVVTALELKDGDRVEYHLGAYELIDIRKAKREDERNTDI